MSVHRPAPRTRLVLALAAGVAAVVWSGGPASAREGGGVVTIAPGVVPAPSTACSPVKSFKHSSTTGVGDTGLSSVEADYQVKPCDSKQSVTVEVSVVQENDPADVLRDDTEAPLSGRITVVGVRLETWYRITITVRDAVTGATVGSASALEIAHRPTGA